MNRKSYVLSITPLYRNIEYLIAYSVLERFEVHSDYPFTAPVRNTRLGFIEREFKLGSKPLYGRGLLGPKLGEMPTISTSSPASTIPAKYLRDMQEGLIDTSAATSHSIAQGFKEQVVQSNMLSADVHLVKQTRTEARRALEAVNAVFEVFTDRPKDTTPEKSLQAGYRNNYANAELDSVLSTIRRNYEIADAHVQKNVDTTLRILDYTRPDSMLSVHSSRQDPFDIYIDAFTGVTFVKDFEDAVTDTAVGTHLLKEFTGYVDSATPVFFVNPQEAIIDEFEEVKPTVDFRDIVVDTFKQAIQSNLMQVNAPDTFMSAEHGGRSVEVVTDLQVKSRLLTVMFGDTSTMITGSLFSQAEVYITEKVASELKKDLIEVAVTKSISSALRGIFQDVDLSQMMTGVPNDTLTAISDKFEDASAGDVVRDTVTDILSRTSKNLSFEAVKFSLSTAGMEKAYESVVSIAESASISIVRDSVKHIAEQGGFDLIISEAVGHFLESASGYGGVAAVYDLSEEARNSLFLDAVEFSVEKAGIDKIYQCFYNSIEGGTFDNAIDTALPFTTETTTRDIIADSRAFAPNEGGVKDTTLDGVGFVPEMATKESIVVEGDINLPEGAIKDHTVDGMENSPEWGNLQTVISDADMFTREGASKSVTQDAATFENEWATWDQAYEASTFEIEKAAKDYLLGTFEHALEQALTSSKTAAADMFEDERAVHSTTMDTEAFPITTSGELKVTPEVTIFETETGALDIPVEGGDMGADLVTANTDVTHEGIHSDGVSAEKSSTVGDAFVDNPDVGSTDTMYEGITEVIGKSKRIKKRYKTLINDTEQGDRKPKRHRTIIEDTTSSGRVPKRLPTIIENEDLGVGVPDEPDVLKKRKTWLIMGKPFSWSAWPWSKKR